MDLMENFGHCLSPWLTRICGEKKTCSFLTLWTVVCRGPAGDSFLFSRPQIMTDCMQAASGSTLMPAVCDRLTLFQDKEVISAISSCSKNPKLSAFALKGVTKMCCDVKFWSLQSQWQIKVRARGTTEINYFLPDALKLQIPVSKSEGKKIHLYGRIIVTAKWTLVTSASSRPYTDHYVFTFFKQVENKQFTQEDAYVFHISGFPLKQCLGYPKHTRDTKKKQSLLIVWNKMWKFLRKSFSNYIQQKNS